MKMKKGWKKSLAAVMLAATVLGTTTEAAFVSNNTVYAAETAQRVMEETISVGNTKTYKQYDVTGDDKADTLKVKVGKKSVVLYVNGKKAYTQKASVFEDVMVSLYKMDGKTPMLALNSDWYSQIFSKLLQYKSGKFVQQINMSNARGFAWGRDLKITPNKITVNYMEEHCIGNSTFAYTYTKKNGKWNCSKYGKYVPESYNGSGISAIKSFPVYKNVDLKTKAFTVKNGANVQIKKCRVYKGKFYIQIAYKGKKGWIKDNGSQAGIFNAVFAG